MIRYNLLNRLYEDSVTDPILSLDVSTLLMGTYFQHHLHFTDNQDYTVNKHVIE